MQKQKEEQAILKKEIKEKQGHKQTVTAPKPIVVVEVPNEVSQLPKTLSEITKISAEPTVGAITVAKPIVEADVIETGFDFIGKLYRGPTDIPYKVFKPDSFVVSKTSEAPIGTEKVNAISSILDQPIIKSIVNASTKNIKILNEFKVKIPKKSEDSPSNR